MEEIEAEIEDGAGNALAIDDHVRFIEVPATRAADEDGGLVAQLVALALVFEADRASRGIAQVDLALHHHVPRRCRGVFQAGHEALRAAVEGVDHHLAVARPGDLDAAIGQICRGGAHLPAAIITDRRIFRRKADEAFLIDPRLPLIPRTQQGQPGRIVHAMQLGNEGQRFGGEDGLVTGLHGALDLDTLQGGIAGHGRPFIHR